MGGPAGLEFSVLMMQRSLSGLSSGWSYRPNWLLKSRDSWICRSASGVRAGRRPFAGWVTREDLGSPSGDCYPRAPIPIDLAVLRATQSTLITQRLIPLVVLPSARDRPWVSGAIS